MPRIQIEHPNAKAETFLQQGLWNSDTLPSMIERLAAARPQHVALTDGSRSRSYAELWGGLTPTFWDNAQFPPGSALGWSEQWQPVARIRGVSLAGAWGTIYWDGVTARIQPVRKIEGATLVVRAPGGVVRASLPFEAAPDRPASLPLAGTVGELEVLGPDSRSMLRGTPVR